MRFVAGENDMLAARPIQDFVGQPYEFQTNPPAAPSREVVEERTRTALASDEFTDLRRQIDHDLGVADRCDVVDTNVCNDKADVDTELENQQRCDEAPLGADPEPDLSKAEFHPDLYTLAQSFERHRAPQEPDGTGTLLPDGTRARETALRMGWARAVTTKQRWRGFGWRHITAKHGWSATDAAQTSVALLLPPVHVGTSDGVVDVVKHVGPEFERNGAICRRRVIVGPTKVKPDEPAPKEIITSFAEFVRIDA